MIRYNNLDGIRAYACICIIFMHTLHFGNFEISGFIYKELIPSFTYFTALFMMISAFSMCCGYYKKFQERTITIEEFYKKRIKRIWPFFAVFCTIELIINHDINSVYEWFADLTLMFGFIPNHNIHVVGVGWYIGIIVLFYIIFPFFIFLMRSKKRAWITMIISIILHGLCYLRFTEAISGGNIIYSSIYFVAGGLIFLYREALNEKTGLFAALIACLATIFYFVVNASSFSRLILFSAVLIVGVACNGRIAQSIFQNKGVRIISKYSMEIYICQMFAFHASELMMRFCKINISELTRYWLTTMITAIGAFLIAFVGKNGINILMRRQRKIK